MFWNRRKENTARINTEIDRVETEVKLNKKKVQESVDVVSSKAHRLNTLTEENHFTIRIYRTIGGKN